jgi:hypothetical protein
MGKKLCKDDDEGESLMREVTTCGWDKHSSPPRIYFN